MSDNGRTTLWDRLFDWKAELKRIEARAIERDRVARANSKSAPPPPPPPPFEVSANFSTKMVHFICRPSNSTLIFESKLEPIGARYLGGLLSEAAEKLDPLACWACINVPNAPHTCAKCDHGISLKEPCGVCEGRAPSSPPADQVHS